MASPEMLEAEILLIRPRLTCLLKLCKLLSLLLEIKTHRALPRQLLQPQIHHLPIQLLRNPGVLRCTPTTPTQCHGSNAFSGRARGLMINFGTDSAPGAPPQQGTTESCANSFFVTESGHTPSDTIEIPDAEVFFDACECLPYDNVHAPVDMDLFFDTSEFFDDKAVIAVCAGEIARDQHLGASDQARSFIQMSSPRLSFATRAARGAKVALVTLKYIATHELTGVLQPLIGNSKRSYVPKRQLQAFIMLFLFVGMTCVTVGVTSVSHRAHSEAKSTMSILVKPLLFSVAMSNIVNLSWYNFFMIALQRALFPISPLRYSSQNQHRHQGPILFS
jgi:hypothetical protein